MRRAVELLMYTDVMTLVVDKATEEVEYANTQARRHHALSEGDKLNLRGMLESCIFESNEERTRVEDSIRSLTLQADPFQFECRRVAAREKKNTSSAPTPVGEVVWHKVVVVPCTHSDTGRDGLLVSAYDISELKRVQFDLRAANEAQDMLVASVTHELRTPLSGMIGLTDALMRDAKCPPGMRRNLEIVITPRPAPPPPRIPAKKKNNSFAPPPQKMNPPPLTPTLYRRPHIPLAAGCVSQSGVQRAL